MKCKANVKTFWVICLSFLMALMCIGFMGNFKTVYASTALQGEGTLTSPYLVEDIDDLKVLREEVNQGNSYDGKYIKLTADIDLANEPWTPIGTSNKTFCGMFDGDNHTISNLKIDWSKNYVSGGNNQNYAGLFGYMKGGNDAGIKNLTIENADVTGCLYVGVILGRSYTGGIIENCHVKGQISVEAYSYAGIIVGRHEYSSGLNLNGEKMSIYNCSVEGVGQKASISCDYAVSYVGGIVGFVAEEDFVFSDLSVKNADIIGTYSVGGISGIGHYGNVFKNVSVDAVSVLSVNSDPESPRAGNVGLIVGACQGTETKQTVFKNYEIEESNASVNGEEVEVVFGNQMTGVEAVTNFVAKVGNLNYYETVSEAVQNATFEDEVTLIRNTDEVFEVPAGIVLNTNGYEAENVSIKALEIADVQVSRNEQDNATVVTITYLNSEKVTTFIIPDGKDGVNGANGSNGKDGKDGKDGTNGTNGLDGKDGVNGVNGKDGANGISANSNLTIVALVVGVISLLGNTLLVFLFLKKRK